MCVPRDAKHLANPLSLAGPGRPSRTPASSCAQRPLWKLDSCSAALSGIACGLFRAVCPSECVRLKPHLRCIADNLIDSRSARSRISPSIPNEGRCRALLAHCDRPVHATTFRKGPSSTSMLEGAVTGPHLRSVCSAGCGTESGHSFRMSTSVHSWTSVESSVTSQA